jgi:hypothetical protein
MAEIVNLRQVRKRKARDDKEKTAEANRLAYGRTKTEKQGTKLEQARADRLLDAHRKDEGDKPPHPSRD